MKKFLGITLLTAMIAAIAAALIWIGHREGINYLINQFVKYGLIVGGTGLTTVVSACVKRKH